MEIVSETNISIPRWIKKIMTGSAAFVAHKINCKSQKKVLISKE